MPSTDYDALPSELFDVWIAELGDWRDETLLRVRALIHVGLFNASLSAGPRRAIGLRHGDELVDDAFEELVVGAVVHNTSRA